MKAKKFFLQSYFFIFVPTHYALFGELSVDRLWQKTFHNRNKSKVSLLVKGYFQIRIENTFDVASLIHPCGLGSEVWAAPSLQNLSHNPKQENNFS